VTLRQICLRVRVSVTTARNRTKCHAKRGVGSPIGAVERADTLSWHPVTVHDCTPDERRRTATPDALPGRRLALRLW